MRTVAVGPSWSTVLMLALLPVVGVAPMVAAFPIASSAHPLEFALGGFYALILATAAPGALSARFTETALEIGGRSIDYRTITAALAQISFIGPFIVPGAAFVFPRLGATRWVVYDGEGDRRFSRDMAAMDPSIQARLSDMADEGRKLCVQPVSVLLVANRRFISELRARVPEVLLTPELQPEMAQIGASSHQRWVVYIALFAPLLLAGIVLLFVLLARR